MQNKYLDAAWNPYLNHVHPLKAVLKRLWGKNWMEMSAGRLPGSGRQVWGPSEEKGEDRCYRNRPHLTWPHLILCRHPGAPPKVGDRWPPAAPTLILPGASPLLVTADWTGGGQLTVVQPISLCFLKICIRRTRRQPRWVLELLKGVGVCES